MADNEKLIQAIDSLRFENAQYHDENYLKQGKQVANSELTVSLMTDLVNEFREGRLADKLDAEERRRENKKDDGPAPAGPRPSASSDNDLSFDMKGILATVAGIGAAVAGLAVGLAGGVKNMVAVATAGMRMRLRNFLAPVTRFIDGIADSIRNSSKGLRLTDKIKDMLQPVRNVTDSIRRFFSNIGTGFRNVGNTTNQFGKTVRLTVKDFTTVAGKIGATVGNFVNRFKDIQTAVAGVGSSFDIRAFQGLVDKIIKPVKSFINGIRGVGQSTNAIAKTMRSFFSAFKVIGRLVAFPLTVIMGIIDGFKGLQAGADRQIGLTNKILGGAIGAITGVIKGLVGMPLDLLKSAVSWIAGKLGFSQFESILDSFSFATFFEDIGNRLTDVLVNLKDKLIYTVTNLGASIMRPFEDGFSFGSVIEFVLTIPGKLAYGLLDLLKSGVASLAELIGFGDFATALESFSFLDAFDELITLVKELPQKAINALVETFNFDTVREALTVAGDFASMASAKIKGLLAGLLPDPDSLAAKLVPDALYEWANEPPPPPPEPVVAEGPAATETENAISRAEQPQEIRGVDEDGFEYIERRRPASMDRPASTAIAGTRDIYGEEFIDPVTGEARRQKVFEADPVIAAKLQKDNDEFFAELERNKAQRSGNNRGAELDNMSRANAQQGGAGNTVVVAAPSQNNTTNNSTNTAAIIDQNLPTMDMNDRSWSMGYSA